MQYASQYGYTAVESLLKEAAAKASSTVIHGAGHNYYEVPYAGETSVLTEITGDEKTKIIEKYNFPTTVNDFLDDGNSITRKLVGVYR